MRSGVMRATADLTWYFEHGVTMSERSPSGYMLERADTFKPRKRRDPERSQARRDRRRRMRATGEWEPSPDELTAQPIHETVTSSRSDAFDEDVPIRESKNSRKGMVDRRLKAIALADPHAARALVAAFGVQGAKWAHHQRGRNVALFPLTVAGAELIARSRRLSPRLDMNDAERLHVEVEIDRIQDGRDAIRRRLITRATVEAAGLLGAALELWVRTP